MIVSSSSVSRTKTVANHITASNVHVKNVEITGVLDTQRMDIDDDLTLTVPIHVDDRLQFETTPTIGTLTLNGRSAQEHLRTIVMGYGLTPEGPQLAENNLLYVSHKPLGFDGLAQNRVGTLAPNRITRINEVDQGGHVTGRLTEVGLDRVFVRPSDLETRQPGRSLVPGLGNNTLIMQWLKSVGEIERRKWWKRLDMTQPYATLDLQGTGPFSALLRLLDGRIAFIPSTSDQILVRDTTGAISRINLPQEITRTTTGNRFRGGTVLPNGEVALTPFELDNFVIWNPYTNAIDAFDGEGFVGALDGRLTPVPPIGDSLPLVCLSLRRQFGSYRGPAVRVRRVSDNQSADLYFDEQGNVISYQVVNSFQPPFPIENNDIESWSGNDPPKVEIWYNQAREGQFNANASGDVFLIKRGTLPGPFPFAIDFSSAKSSITATQAENYLQIEYNPVFALPDRLTLSCVHWPKTWGPQDWTNLVGRGNRHMLRRHANENAMRLTLRQAQSNDIFGNELRITNQLAGQSYYYYHVGTYDRQLEGDKNAFVYSWRSDLYPDFDAKGSGQSSIAMDTDTPSNWLIGRHGGEDNRGERPYHGVMYDIQIYNRAITRNEIQSIWTSIRD